MSQGQRSSAYTGAFGDENPFTGSAGEVIGKVRYRPLNGRSSASALSFSGRTSSTSSRGDDDFADSQFVGRAAKIPYKAIALAIVLFLLGSILCTVGGLLLSGLYIDAKYNDRTWPVLFLGLIMFVPGFYHVRIAYYAYHRIPGYEYSDIPDWD